MGCRQSVSWSPQSCNDLCRSWSFTDGNPRPAGATARYPQVLARPCHGVAGHITRFTWYKYKVASPMISRRAVNGRGGNSARLAAKCREHRDATPRARTLASSPGGCQDVFDRRPMPVVHPRQPDQVCLPNKTLARAYISTTWETDKSSDESDSPDKPIRCIRRIRLGYPSPSRRCLRLAWQATEDDGQTPQTHLRNQRNLRNQRLLSEGARCLSRQNWL